MQVRSAAHPIVRLAVMAALATGCSARPDTARQEAAQPVASGVVTVVAHDFGYEMPSVVPAGVTTIELVNRGQELHHMQIARLDEGHSAADLITALEQKTIPTWALPLGGPNGVEPGQSATTIQTLTPGHYAVLCLIPSPDGRPHFMKGMTGGFEVVASPVAGSAEPVADATFSLSDYAFGAPSIAAGHRVIRVENSATQPHELVLVRLDSGKSVADMLHWFVAGEKGAPPGHFVSGVVALGPGQHSFFAQTFEPGNYGLLCFVEDAGDGKPHVMHGMVSQFTVGAEVAVKN